MSLDVHLHDTNWLIRPNKAIQLPSLDGYLFTVINTFLKSSSTLITRKVDRHDQGRRSVFIRERYRMDANMLPAVSPTPQVNVVLQVRYQQRMRLKAQDATRSAYGRCKSTGHKPN